MLKSPKIVLKSPYLLIIVIIGMSSSFCLSEEIVLSILHTNDTYGRLLPYSRDNVEFGGVLRRAYVIRQICSENPGSVIVVDAGDAISPYPLSAFDQGKTVIQMMNKMGYTAMALGNHEFDYGLTVLRERISEAQFAMLSANAIVEDTGKPLSQGYITTEAAGIKVGIFGLTTQTAQYRAAPHLLQPIKFADPFSAAKDAVKELKSQGCDFIIVLSHMGYQSDMELSAQVEGINLIVGGEIRSDDEKLITVLSPVDYSAGATLVYCPWFGGYVGRVDVYLEKQNVPAYAGTKYVIKDIRARKYQLDERSYPDQEIYLSDIKSMLDSLIDKYQITNVGTLGKVAGDEEINSLELIPLIVRKKTRSEIVLLNRGSLKPIVFKGDITRIQAVESVQYTNQVFTLDMSGAQLRSALAHSGRQVNENRTLIFSGIENNGATVNGRPLDPNEYYKVATNDFLAYGGDGYDMIASARNRRGTGLMLQQLVIDYIQSIQSSGKAVSLEPLKASLPKYVVKSKLDLGLLIEGLTVSETASKYPKINLVQSKNVGNFSYWNVQNGISSFLASPEYYLEMGLAAKYGRLQHPRSDSIELDDNMQGFILFKFMPGKWKLDPITRFEFENLEITPSDERHPVTQLSAGAEQKIHHLVTTSYGVLLRRYREENVTQNQVDFDFRVNFQAIVKGVALQSEFKFFPVFIDSASDDPLFKNYITSFVNTVKFPLNRYLFLFANAALYRETRVGPWAYKAEIAMQVRQIWGKKP